MLKQAIKAIFVLSMSLGLLAGCGDGKPEKAVEKAATVVKKMVEPAAENAARQAAVPPAPSGEKIEIEADMKASMYVTVAVTEKGKPVEGADVAVKGKKVGTTDKNGEFLYEYKTAPGKGVEFSVSKAGLAPWSMSVKKLTPGQKIEVALSKRTVIDVSCLTDEYGRSAGVAGIVVSVDGKAVGKTDAKGVLTYRYTGKPGKKARLTLSAPGYIPAEWETRVALQGDVKIQRFFYPAAPRAIRTGIYGFVSNSPDADLRMSSRGRRRRYRPSSTSIPPSGKSRPRRCGPP